MKTRMQPIGNAWQKLPRVVRDLVRRTRQADRTRDGRRRHRARPPGARTDQGSAHAHGAQLRRPRHRDARRAAGRRQARAAAQSAFAPITRAARSSSRSPTTAAASTPSGSGARRVENGLVTRGRAREHDASAQIHKFIFTPASRPPQTVTRVSGRGVGMDVVQTNIEQIGGTVDIKSKPGEGTTVTIKIPLTLAIVPALIVRSRRRALRDPAARRARAGARRARNSEHRDRAHQGHAGPAAARQAAAADAPDRSS